MRGMDEPGDQRNCALQWQCWAVLDTPMFCVNVSNPREDNGAFRRLSVCNKLSILCGLHLVKRAQNTATHTLFHTHSHIHSCSTHTHTHTHTHRHTHTDLLPTLRWMMRKTTPSTMHSHTHARTHPAHTHTQSV